MHCFSTNQRPGCCVEQYLVTATVLQQSEANTAITKFRQFKDTAELNAQTTPKTGGPRLLRGSVPE
jgi:hypothetical protein